MIMQADTIYLSSDKMFGCVQSALYQWSNTACMNVPCSHGMLTPSKVKENQESRIPRSEFDEGLDIITSLWSTTVRDQAAQAANYSNYDSLLAEINFIKRRLSRAH